MLYVIIFLLILGAFVIDFLPKRKEMPKRLRVFYLLCTIFSVFILMITQSSLPWVSIGTLLTILLQKIYGI